LDIPVICAEQRRKYARVAVASDAVACAQKQTPAVDPDAPVLLHVGCKVPDHPDLASGCDSSHRGIRRTGGNIADPSTEPDQALGRGRLSNGSYDENYGN
jgi:hypothetical protein